jgi:hypothetical protein
MKRNKSDSLPEFDSLDELVNYFDSHDLGGLWGKMPEIEFEIDIQPKTHLVALEDELLEHLNEIASKRNSGSAELINMWLREKVAEQTVS